jgi:putative hemolysin
VIMGVSYLSIVVGELVPKSLALRGAETYALLIGRPLLALSWLATPLVWLLSASANVILRPFGDRTTFTETRHSADELQQLVEEAAREGTIHPDAGEIAARALELPELTVSDVMVPRQDVIVTSRRAPAEELRRLFRTHSHSRIPVYEDRVDNIVGYLGGKDVLARVLEGNEIVVDELLRPPFFVPEQKNAVELLQELRARHLPLAIVVDEQGGVSGIVTMEDLLEELVGEIFDEHVEHAPRLVERVDDGTALVSGAAPIREVNRALGSELPDEGSWTTIAGLCLALAGHIPTAGHSFSLSNGIVIEVVEASARRVRRVRVRPPAPATDDQAPS